MASLGASVGVDAADVSLPPVEQRSTVFAADGSVLAVLHGDTNRVPVPLSRMAPMLVKAVIDTEDASFWHHGGIDLHSVIRAATHDAKAGEVREGGSTITQQLVKNTLLTPERSLRRKLRELVLADRLERQLGKRAVLERYLNTVFLGQGASGVEAAAETYFQRSAADLDVAQAALLAGLIRSPTSDDPIRHLAAARARRKAVLERMVDQHHLSPDAARRAASAPLPTTATPAPLPHDYFTAAVTRELLEDPRLGSTVDARRRLLLEGGLRVHTTVEPRMQQLAERVVTTGVPGGRQLSGALVAVDPASGAVRALVGGTDFGAAPFDAAAAGGRQPGSAFKAFTLVAALEAGHNPNETVDGSTPCRIPNPGGTPNPWVPTNFEGERFGTMSLTDATAHSVNCAFARLATQVGYQSIVDVAHRMGVRARLRPMPSLTLGTEPVPPLEMAAAYATLASNGIAHRVHLVDRVERPDGRPLIVEHDDGHRVIDPATAATATNVLTHVVTDGTGRASALPGRPTAGKTGTAQDYRDAWFVGYTPQLATAVWMGNPASETPMPAIGGPIVGGRFPAAMWQAFMAEALADQPVAGFAPAPALPPLGPGVPAGAQPSATPGKTWCWSSCGKPGRPPHGNH